MQACWGRLRRTTLQRGPTSEAAVQEALAAALEGRTSLVIAHWLSTIRSADQILVVEDGRIVERGTHDELLGAGGRYDELHRTQFRDQARGTEVVAQQTEPVAG